MRLTARALSVTALAGAALGAAASAAFADPAVEVSPGSVEPGGTVTISVTCDEVDGTPPEYIDATSEGFEAGKVQLRRVPDTGVADTAVPDTGVQGTDVQGTDVPDVGVPDTGVPDTEGSAAAGASVAGTAYSGTARIPPGETVDDGGTAADAGSEWGVDGACPVEPGGTPKQWTASYTVAPRATVAGGTVQNPPTGEREDDLSTGEREDDLSTGEREDDLSTGEREDDLSTGEREDDLSTGERDDDLSTDEREEDSSSDERGEDSSYGEREDEDPATVQRGVDAGEGGAFTGSVPALIAGSVLMAGAVGAAAHRLWRKAGSTDA
ncbi:MULTISPECIES: hypothetical protein [Streptomyces]|uniref:Secreted protein n=1 Tax=Streptomyces dengpaensis TaxID=2049881 RepID=A0ABN5HWD4_9ACTN|nr:MULTISPECIES: hypothetical protein [Streptomyces]AVH55459.1 hypothetical protein C4B68_06335 [Streptomyces dengpaensis]PIB11724.1 hypothetical protein B1C81_00300 [Streptomyces sp. HG99]